MKRRRISRSTPAGQHRPVLLEEVLAVLQPRPGMVVVDATLGGAGHAEALLRKVTPGGMLIGMDLDAGNLPSAQHRLAAAGASFHLHHANFAGLSAILAQHGLDQIDGLVADLGMSSMQVDDPERGFSYSRDGVLDMRMDQTRGKTAAQLLRTLLESQLRRALAELGDESQAEGIARALVEARGSQSLERTGDLARFLLQTLGENQWHLRQSRQRWQTHPAARTFQALRILVNRELENLRQLLRILPQYLKSGGKAALISFHSGEDRLVKAALREGQHQGVYRAIATEPIRPNFQEKQANPRSRSAKLRWAEKV